MRSCRREGERGMTLILVALCIVVFIGMAALAVDVGVLYTARTSAQHAADAGALAGATTFVLQPSASNPTATAVDAAVRIANQNNVLGTPAGITAGDVTVYVANRRVTVVVPRTAARGNAITLFFARIFGLTTSDIGASATAEASLTPTAARCIRPVFMPNTALAPPGTKLTTACKNDTLLNPVNGKLTTFGQSQIGSSFTLKNNSGGGSFVPSQYAELDFGSGSSTYRCLWSSCINDPTCGADQSLVDNGVKCAVAYPVKTGNSPGPTNQGVGDFTGNPADTWGGIGPDGPYYNTTSGTATTSRSLTVVPVWDNCAHPITSGTNGQTVTVIGFAQIFVDGVDANGNILAHLVEPLGCSSSGGGTGPFATPVRLVQAPPAS